MGQVYYWAFKFNKVGEGWPGVVTPLVNYNAVWLAANECGVYLSHLGQLWNGNNNVNDSFCRALRDGDEIKIMFDRVRHVLQYTLNQEPLPEVDVNNLAVYEVMHPVAYVDRPSVVEVDIL